jgi:hypothetical protein
MDGFANIATHMLGCLSRARGPMTYVTGTNDCIVVETKKHMRMQPTMKPTTEMKRISVSTDPVCRPSDRTLSDEGKNRSVNNDDLHQVTEW